MTAILAIDPGAKPGFAWVDPGVLDPAGAEEDLTHDPELVPDEPWDELVIEDQFLTKYIYRNGKRVRVSPKTQVSLIRTAERLLLQFPAAKKYRIAPTAWRAVLWPGAGRIKKAVVLARLRRDEPELLRGATDDAVEARGILRAWLTLTPAQKKKYEVK